MIFAYAKQYANGFLKVFAYANRLGKPFAYANLYAKRILIKVAYTKLNANGKSRQADKTGQDTDKTLKHKSKGKAKQNERKQYNLKKTTLATFL